eukprot:GDKJ01010904.1.p1 GENE.GDKJ01010904.1~~GDKJ01010904.1.p1  ORF type:complete len:642 (-),score=161.14 GDKJ01010904.1:133-1935(-)
MVNRGQMTLSEILKFSEQPFLLVRNALLTLIQHNLVTSDYHPSEGDRASFYSFDIEKAISRLRYPRYIDAIEKRSGFISRLILFEVMKDGRISMEECIARVQDKAEEVAAKERVSCPSLATEVLRSNFIDLILLGGLRKVPHVVFDSSSSSALVGTGVTSQVTQRQSTPKAKSKRASAKSAKSAADTAAMASKTGQRHAATGGLMALIGEEGNLMDDKSSTQHDVMRMLTSSSASATGMAVLQDVEDEEEIAANNKRKSPSATAKSKKRARQSGLVDDSKEAMADLALMGDEYKLSVQTLFDSNVSMQGIYMIDPKSLDLILFANHAESLLVSRLGTKQQLHHLVIRVLVREMIHRHVKAFALGDVVNGVGRLQSENDLLALQIKSFDREQVRTFLDSACGVLPHFLDKITLNSGASVGYKLNLDNVKLALRSRIVTLAVRARGGVAGVRIFNFLKSISSCSDYPSGKVEDSVVAEKCLVTPAVARSTLMTLVNNGLMYVQDIARVAQSGNAKSVLFFVREHESLLKLEEGLLKTLMNLRARVVHENRLLSKSVVWGLMQKEGSKKNSEALLEARVKAEDLLDAHIQQVDEALFLIGLLE